MITIASLFDRKSSKRTGAVWDLLETECEMIGIKSIPVPHFSWLTGADFTFAQADKLLDNLSRQITGFEITTSGLGIFTGPAPIIYLPIIKTADLLAYHRLIWEAMAPAVVNINSYYSPQNWIPHITIGYGDVTMDNLACALEKLLNYELSLTITIDNIAYLSREEMNARIERVVKLKDATVL